MWATYTLTALAMMAALAVGPAVEPSSPLAQPTDGRAAAPQSPARGIAADTAVARKTLDALSEQYRLLEDVTVRVGPTPLAHEAVAYYAKGEIVVSDQHSVEIKKILAHEIWHVIDWRDNGRLDWGEDLPPANAADYLAK